MERDLGAALKRVLPAPDADLLRLIARVAEAEGLALYAVGGLPRDLALGRKPSDFDLVVEGSAIALSQALVGEFGGTVTAHARFGTAQWHLEQSRTPSFLEGHAGSMQERRAQIDLVSARRESYSHPAALPHVTLGSIEDDLQRRDFTINTLALRLDGRHYGQVLDPLGAVRDLETGIIRALHEASFQDDPTRMLRAVRYEQRLAFRIDSATLRMIPPAAKWLRQVSPHRVRQELNAMLQEEQAARAVRRMGRLGLLRTIHPGLPVDRASLKRLGIASLPGTDGSQTRHTSSDASIRWLLWFLDLAPGEIRAVRRRLLFDSRLTADMLAASGLWRARHGLARLRPSELTARLDGLPLVAVRVVEGALPKSRSQKMFQEYLLRWRLQRPITTGADLRRRGISPGPVYREVLNHLRAGWIDGEIGDAADEQAALEAWLRKDRHHGKSRVGRDRESRRRRT